jgi:hypothetical protein
MAGKRSPQNPLINQLTSPPETIPSCDPENAPHRFSTTFRTAPPARYGNIEAGAYKLSIAVANAIVEAVPGMTLDWLYYGRSGGLERSLRDRLVVAREEMAGEARRLSR